MLAKFLAGQAGIRAHQNGGTDFFAQTIVWHAEDTAFGNRWMAIGDGFDLNAINVFTAA